MKVSDSMTKTVISVGANEPVAVAARLMARYNLGMLPVQNAAGKLVGVVTDRDLAVRALTVGKPKTVSDVMTRSVVTASPEETMEQAVSKMGSRQVRRLPVVQNGKMVGVISLGDAAETVPNPTMVGDCLGRISSAVQRMDESKE